MRKAIQEYYRALNLSPGATPFEIRRAYRQLIRRWHPDFFKPGSPMQTTAEDITKETNEAFEQLYKKKLYRKFPPKGKSAAGSEDPGFDASDDESDAQPEVPKPEAPPPRREKRKAAKRAPAASQAKTASKRTAAAIDALRRWPWGKAAIFIGLVVAGLAIWRGLPRPSPEALAGAVNRRLPETGSPQATVRISIPPRATEPSGPASDHQAVEATTVVAVTVAESRPPADSFTAGSSPEVFARPTESAAPSANTEMPESSSYLRVPDYTGPPATSFSSSDPDEIVDQTQALLETFGMGDSKATVISIQGAPDEARESVFRYGSSLVYFDEKGQVRGWSDRRPQLRVRVWPTIDQVSLDTFALGSSRSDVMRAMGRPTGFSRFDYRYGSSVIRFENDRVIDWNEGDIPLRAFTMPALPAFIDLDHR
jgi:hypothetical protein